MNDVFNEILNSGEFSIDEIPQIDLYMDQIITLFENKYSKNKRNESEKILTKTMVNNYTKEKLLKPVRGKTYNREQILQLILIYKLKQTLSVQDIKVMFDELHRVEHNQFNVYNIAMQNLANHKEDINKSLETLIEKDQAFDNKYSENLYNVLVLSLVSDYYKRMAQSIIDDFFVDKLQVKREKPKKANKKKKVNEL